jgi:hypothetical protein
MIDNPPAGAGAADSRDYSFVNGRHVALEGKMFLM